MRILLDESLPIELASELSGYDVTSVQKMRWSGLKNGELLARAAGQFDVVLTADQNLPYQQNLDRLPIAVIVIAAKSNRVEALRPLMPGLGPVNAIYLHAARERRVQGEAQATPFGSAK